MISIFFIFLLFIPPVSCEPGPIHTGQEEICGDKDIRNVVSNFKKLENCTVIEGFLQILLIDRADTSEYENLTFPKLREITGFFLLYRVAGLRSLRNLFPNLSVIRGTKLFHNFALVVYEMMSLEEISLPSLTHILRGSVHIMRNPHLCYVNTIDWDLIAKSGKGDHFIKQNRESNECPDQCPTQLNCPKSPDKSLCWNQHVCQKVCDAKCGNRSCSTPDECCSELCLGGCSGKSSTDCFVCAGVLYQNKCSKSCPPSTYKYADRRCLTENECIGLPREVWDKHELLQVNWKVFQNQCLQECPSGFMEDEKNKHACKKCIGPCPKVCNGITVDSVATAQELRGCTRISGALEIQISGGENIVRELEENLQTLEEVDDYVKIVRSFPLVSLNFLKNLTKINGTKKDNSDYSLLVIDNHNLQELFDLKNGTRKLELVAGKIFFHLNPKLCLSKIKELNDALKLPDWEEQDVSSRTNGDRTACNVKRMKAKVISHTARSAIIQWDNVRGMFSDHRSLLGYVVSYQEALSNNVSIYDGRDACSGDRWKELDVAASDSKEYKPEALVIPDLKPFTLYAVYIRTYTVGNEDLGTQSDIIYFRTLSDNPSNPQDLKAVASSPFELKLSWSPPLRPNGIVTHYVIKGILEKDVQELLDRRNYCEQNLVVTPPKQELKVPIPTEEMPSQCAPSKETIDLKEAAKEAEFENQFEDMIHNHVFLKNHKYLNSGSGSDDFSRSKRSIDKDTFKDHSLSTGSTSLATTITPFWSSTTQQTILEPEHFITISNTTSITIKSLKHFSIYYIEVSACHKDEGKIILCSPKSITTARTAPLPFADIINYEKIVVKVQNDTLGKVFIKWDEPEDPNGVIVTFEIEYKRTNIENYKPVLECITHMQYRERKGYALTNLGPGNYSLRLRATSLAGFSNWTIPIYFIIEDVSSSLSPGMLALIATTSIIVVLVLIGGSLWLFVKKKYAQSIPNGILYASVNPEYISTGDVYVPDEWEVPREKITILEELGQGSFGMVYSGIAKDIIKGVSEVKCAVKTVNESATIRERIEFLNEASVMKAFSSFHVLKLLGVVSKGQPTLVIMELMAKGDLKAYLRSMRPDIEEGEDSSRKPPTLTCILRMASEIADGMAYLAAKKFVHRDLAARNCMVADDLTVKIGDFGMTRDVYETDYYRKGGKGLLPVRWMAPESLKDGVFTSLSDAWSFGVVLWEMATLASQPYQGLSNEQVLKYVIDGGVMEKPEACPNKLYDLMRSCWYQNPKLRPTFLDLVKILLPYVRHSFATNSFYYSQEAERLTNKPPDLNSPTTPLFSPSEMLEEDENELNCSLPFARNPNETSNGSKGLSSGGSNDSKLSTPSSNGGLVNGHFYLPETNVSNC